MLLPLPRSFIVGEEEQTVFPQWSTERSPEDIADQFGGFIRQPVLEFGLLDKEIIGAGDGIAHVFVCGSVEGIRAALGDESHLSTGALPLISTVIRRCDAEFLNRSECHRQD